MNAPETALRKNPAKPVGQLIDELFKKREEKRALEVQAKILAEEYDIIEANLLQALDSQGVTESGGKLASVYISEAVRPNVTDWEAFYKYISRMKYFHLLERRPSVSGCRELFDTKGKIPGVEPFTKRTVNLRTK